MRFNVNGVHVGFPIRESSKVMKEPRTFTAKRDGPEMRIQTSVSKDGICISRCDGTN